MEIKRNVVIISFSTKKSRFRSLSERNRFFRELYGWKQVVIKNGKKYTYNRDGVLTEIPHKRIEDSVFMVPEKNLSDVEEYFKKWKEMVDCHIMRMMLMEENIMREFAEMEKEMRKRLERNFKKEEIIEGDVYD